ncbi:hypothetical protein Tco_0145303 [Tanacetum coccineum]
MMVPVIAGRPRDTTQVVTRGHPMIKIRGTIAAGTRYGYVKYYKKTVKNGQKRTRERMSDQEAKEIKAEAEEIMPQPSTVNCS